MYEIRIDDEILHHPLICRVISPKLSLELDKAGSLTFTMPPTHPLYDAVNDKTALVTVLDDGEIIFRGRVLSTLTDVRKRENVVVEGELAELNDSAFITVSGGSMVADAFNAIIALHNGEMTGSDNVTEKGFTVGTISAAFSSFPLVKALPTGSTSWSVIQSLLSTYGGYLRVRWESGVRYIDYLEDFPATDNGQIIAFGRSITSIQKYIRTGDSFSILLPQGKNNSDTLLNYSAPDVRRGMIEDADLISLVGRIVRYKQFPVTGDLDALYAIGKAYLQRGEIGLSLEVDAVDLSMLGVEIDRIRVGTSSRIVSAPHGIDRRMVCTKATIDLTSPAKTVYKFGSTGQRSMTDRILDFM